MGFLKKALLPFGMGTSKGASLVAEQLTLHHLFIYGGTIDRHKGAGGPRAVEMDGPGKQLLTYSTLPAYVNIGVRTPGNSFGHGEGLQKLGALADKVIDIVFLGKGLS